MKYTVHDAVFAFERANPVPDPQGLADVMVAASQFLTITEETAAMTTTETRSTPPETGTPRGWLVAAAAFGAVILIGAVLALVALDGGGEPSAPPTPTETAHAFIEARTNGDSEASMALLAPEAEFFDPSTAPQSEYSGALAWLSLLEWKWTPTQCTETEVALGTEVTCGYTHQNVWTRARGLDPIDDGGTFVFVVSDGSIVRYTHDWRQTTFSPTVWAPMVGWAWEHYPENAALMFAETDSWTDETLEAWRITSEAYVASLSG